MAYTPINWQTGDTITAEKMNKMDNGWSVENGMVTYFDGTLTTTDADNRETKIDATENFYSASTLSVTLDGTPYTLTGFDDDGYWTWGAPYNDFSEYSFSIYYNQQKTTATFVSQIAGTYTVKIETEGTVVELSENFISAVSNATPTPTLTAKQCIPNVTKRDEISWGETSNLLYFYSPTYLGIYIIQKIGTPCVIMPENSNISASFGRDDGVFRLTES